MEQVRRRPASLAPLLALVLSVLVVTQDGSAAAASKPVIASADAFVDASKPQRTFGTRKSIVVDGSPIRRGYLRFDLTHVSGVLTRASLRLYAQSSLNTGITVRTVPRFRSRERNIRYSNAPAIATAPFAASGPVRAGRWITVNVTPLVKLSGTASLALTSKSRKEVVFASREAGSRNAPRLVVEVQAAPASTTRPAVGTQGSGGPTPGTQGSGGPAPGTKGSGGPALATVAVVGSVQKVRPHDSPVGASSASIFAARNEAESFQLVVRSSGETLQNLSIGLETPLRSSNGTTIPITNVTIYREAYYQVRQSSDREGALGPWPDALIPTVDPIVGEPRNAFPVDVPPGENRTAWVDVLVPANAPAGRYEGSLSINATGFSQVVPVTLTVLNFTLPSTSSLASAFGMDWASACRAHYGDDCWSHYEDGWHIKSLYVQAALDNRLTISSAFYEPPVSAYEQRFFERYTLPYLKGTASTRLPGAKLTSLDIGTRFISNWKSLATAEGFADRAFVYACDEPRRDAGAWDKCRQNAQSARSIWTSVQILVTARIGDARQYGAATPISTLVPTVQQMHDKPSSGANAGNQRQLYDEHVGSATNNRVWLYTSCDSYGDCLGQSPSTNPYYDGWPGYAIDQPASQTRAMGWLPFEYDATGELYWAVDHKLETAWTDQFDFGVNGDGTLFYPGNPSIIGGTQPIPIESLRLKLFRDGREDYEYLKYLADNGQRTQARAVAQQLFPTMYQTNRSDAEVQAARRELAVMISGIAGGPTP